MGTSLRECAYATVSTNGMSRLSPGFNVCRRMKGEGGGVSEDTGRQQGGWWSHTLNGKWEVGTGQKYKKKEGKKQKEDSL